MQETIAQLLSYVWGVWRYRWLALGVAWVVALAGWAYVWKMPESYVATARVYVDTTSVLRPLLTGLAVTPDIEQRVRMMSSTLFSRPNLEKLARMTDLDLNATTPAAEESLISGLRQSITLSGQRGNESLYNISVGHRDRDTARRIAQSLITVFIESSLSGKRGDTNEAQSFLDEQIAEYERRLIEAENRLARFKQQNVDVLPSKAGADYYSRLEALRETLDQTRLDLDASRKRRDAIAGQLESDDGGFDSLVASGVMTPTDARLQQLRIKLDSLLSRYTDRHPEVRQIQGLIRELEAEKQAELAAFKDSGATPGMSANPMYQNVQTLLSEAEGDVAELEARAVELKRREDELAAKVTQIPEVEAQLKALDRDYEVVLGQHQELLERRESARLSQGVEDSASDVTFRVVDPPYVPLEPSEPNKFLLNAAVLVAALGAGAGLALLIAMLRPMVVDARSLADATGLPLLGVVTFSKSAAELRADNLRYAAFGACFLLLVGAFGGVLIAPELLPL